MSRKKQVTYSDMSRAIKEMQERQERERNRIAQLMAVSFLNGGAESVIGDCSDVDLRRIMSFMAADIDRYLDRLNAEKQDRGST